MTPRGRKALLIVGALGVAAFAIWQLTLFIGVRQIGRTVRSTPIYPELMRIAAADRRVVEALGAPLQSGLTLKGALQGHGTWSFSHGGRSRTDESRDPKTEAWTTVETQTNSWTVVIPLSGPRAVGTLRASYDHTSVYKGVRDIVSHTTVRRSAVLEVGRDRTPIDLTMALTAAALNW
jgi:hypothetical protein